MSTTYMGELLRYPDKGSKRGDPIPDRLFCSLCVRGKAQCRPDRAACSILYHRHRADVAEAKLRIAARKLVAQRVEFNDYQAGGEQARRDIESAREPGEIVDAEFADDDQVDEKTAAEQFIELAKEHGGSCPNWTQRAAKVMGVDADYVRGVVARDYEVSMATVEQCRAHVRRAQEVRQA